MARKTVFVMVAGVASTAVATALAVAGGGAASGAAALGKTPEEEAAALGCGRSPLMVIHADLYVPSREGNPARTPQEALDRLLAEHYPRAPRALFRPVAADDARTKYHASNSGGQLLASLLIGSLDDEHYVEQVAVCEATAKGWAR